MTNAPGANRGASGTFDSNRSTPRQDSQTLVGALWAIGRGYRVFPVSPDKTPAITGWQTAATSDPLKVLAWFNEGYAGFGIKCGPESGLWAIDDDREKHGLPPYEPPQHLPETLFLVGQSGKGGRYCFAWPKDGKPIHNSQSKLAAHVDVRACGGPTGDGDGSGQIVAPGSFGGRLARDLPLAEPPEWLLEAARAGRSSGNASDPHGALELLAPPSGEALDDACAWLAKQQPAVSGDGGQTTLIKRAIALVCRGFDLETIEALLISFNTWCEPPWNLEDPTDRAGFYRKIEEALKSQAVAKWAHEERFRRWSERGEAPPIVRANGRYFCRKTHLQDETQSPDYRWTASSERDLALLFKERGKPPLQPSVLDAGIEAARSWIVDYTSEITAYDLATRQLTIGCRTYGEARFDQQVDTWLRALAGPKYDGFAKQIAACAPCRLGAVSRATAIIGPTSVGKTLLAAGMAKCWNQQPVPMRVAIGRFNGVLETCPIVLADEALPAELDGTVYRELLGAHGRSIELKGKERHTVRGALRVFLAVQSDERLVLVGSKTADDIDAIATRTFLCHVPDAEAAKRALEPLLDASGSVADLDRIAGHFRWLWENVEPVAGRFLGAPEDPEALAQVLQGEIDAAPALWTHVASFLAKPEDWTMHYSASAHEEVCKATAVKGKPDPTGASAAPLLIVDGALCVYPTALALMLGWELGTLSAALKPFRKGRIGRRLPLPACAGAPANTPPVLRQWKGYALDRNRIEQALADAGLTSQG